MKSPPTVLPICSQLKSSHEQTITVPSVPQTTASAPDTCVASVMLIRKSQLLSRSPAELYACVRSAIAEALLDSVSRLSASKCDSMATRYAVPVSSSDSRISAAIRIICLEKADRIYSTSNL